MPGIPCIIDCCTRGETGRGRLELKLTTVFTQFNCPVWLDKLRPKLRSGARLCRLWSGSTHAELDVADTDVEAALASPSSLEVDNLELVRDPATGRSVVISSGLPIGVIIAIVIVALLVLAALIVAIILLVRHKRKKDTSPFYTSLATAAAPMPAAAAPAPQRLVNLVVIQTATASTANTLSAEAGSRLTCRPEDWADGGEWLWVTTSLGKEGYVPRELTRMA